MIIKYTLLNIGIFIFNVPLTDYFILLVQFL